MGDVNCDSKVTVSDAILLSRLVSNDTTVDVTAQGKINGDVNHDKSYTANDVVLILKAIAGLTTL